MIEPIKPGSVDGGTTPLKGHTALPAVRGNEATKSQGPLTESPSDNVNVSSAARELQARATAEAPPAGELPPDQVRELARRIAERYYDKPDVLDQVSRRVMDHLDTDRA